MSSIDSQEAIPRPEHPRPDFQRQPWINLNGRWRFAFDPRNIGEQARWHRLSHPNVPATATPFTAQSSMALLGTRDPFHEEIVVPFPWESSLSGIGNTEYKGAAWYQRVLEAPTEWAEQAVPNVTRDTQDLPGAEDTAQSTTATGANVVWRVRPILCFGAVDWGAKVWVDGRFVGEHTGGYTPFELDLSRYLRPGQPATLTVRAWDACEADTLLGKQVEEWYTHSGGIWQTVWLEGRPAACVQHVQITPLWKEGRARFGVTVEAQEATVGMSARLEVISEEGHFPTATATLMLTPGLTTQILHVEIPHPRAWSPEDPHLYDCTVRLMPEWGVADAVSTYFGLRSIERGFWEDNPYQYVLLNGKPIYLRGALDQAFHPDGLHTYPSDAAIRADIQAAKDLGLNMLRCHIKVNDPRYYYWADRLGILMMYDLPSASLYTPTARKHWEETLRAAMQRDYSHPCICAWILFNETWGLEEHQTPTSWNWVRQMFDLAKELDPTRLIEDNSPCLYDHVKTDLNTWHFYINSYERARRHIERVVANTYAGSAFNYVGHRYSHLPESAEYRQASEPLLNSEYAGLGASGGDADVSYSFKFLTTELRRHAKICGYVYTELTDIEWEHNGFLNYDRTAKEFGYEAAFPGMTIADLNGADFIGLDAPPCRTVSPGASLALPAFVSHWDARTLEKALLCWRISACDRFGESCLVGEDRRMVSPRQYGVSEAGTLEVSCPDESCLLTVAVWLEDEAGNVRARNYVQIEVCDEHPAARVERSGEAVALRFSPGDFLDSSRPNPLVGPDGHKFVCGEAGWVEYAIEIPEEVTLEKVQKIRLRMEASARTAHRRLGWKRTWHTVGSSYPQTEAQKFPTEIVVSVNGIVLGRAVLPDDPADARGVLSAHNYENFEYASYGTLIEMEGDSELVRRILAAARGRELVLRIESPRTAGGDGFNLYGARMGAYPIDPMLFLE